MATEITASIYGFFPDNEWQKQRQQKWFEYYKSLIETEKIYPESDWDNIRGIKLLSNIAKSDTNEEQRKTLIDMLDISDEEDDNEN